MDTDWRTAVAGYGGLLALSLAYAAAFRGLAPVVLTTTLIAAGLVGAAGAFALVGLRSDRRVIALAFPAALAVAAGSGVAVWAGAWAAGFLRTSDPTLHAAVVALAAAPWLGLVLGSAERPRQQRAAAGLVVAATAPLAAASAWTLRSPPFDDPPFLLAFQAVLWLLAALVGAGLYGLSSGPGPPADRRAVELAALAPVGCVVVALAVVRHLGPGLVRAPQGLFVALTAVGLFAAVLAWIVGRRV